MNDIFSIPLVLIFLIGTAITAPTPNVATALGDLTHMGGLTHDVSGVLSGSKAAHIIPELQLRVPQTRFKSMVFHDAIPSVERQKLVKPQVLDTKEHLIQSHLPTGKSKLSPIPAHSSPMANVDTSILRSAQAVAKDDLHFSKILDTTELHPDVQVDIPTNYKMELKPHEPVSINTAKKNMPVDQEIIDNRKKRISDTTRKISASGMKTVMKEQLSGV
ncbi:hypothetical protein FRB94_010656 [Tulasnella sp. JGI-2019a]|nr:hypothetical protein FRB94_010656 [Tulasnella sp. JGI-2019a]KAG9011321.1 hypothetical protein FRB93_003123 [Tulasnella sp. JGI-2019a]